MMQMHEPYSLENIQNIDWGGHKPFLKTVQKPYNNIDSAWQPGTKEENFAVETGARDDMSKYNPRQNSLKVRGVNLKNMRS